MNADLVDVAQENMGNKRMYRQPTLYQASIAKLVELVEMQARQKGEAVDLRTWDEIERSNVTDVWQADELTEDRSLKERDPGIAIVVLATIEVASTNKHTLKLMRRYARKHGYSFFVETKKLEPRLQIIWSVCTYPCNAALRLYLPATVCLSALSSCL